MLQARKSFTNLRRSISPRGGTGLVGSLLYTVGFRRFISTHIQAWPPPLPRPLPRLCCRRVRLRAAGSLGFGAVLLSVPHAMHRLFFPEMVRDPRDHRRSVRRGFGRRQTSRDVRVITFPGLGDQGAVVVWCSITPTVAPLESLASSFVVKLDERNDSRLIYAWLG
jgi:hypothetical protein